MRTVNIAMVLSAALLIVSAAGCRKQDGIVVSGTIEATATELAFKLPGIVEERRVSEGDSVSQGQVVARLDDDELRLETDLRKADLAAAQSALQMLEAGARGEEIAQAEAAWRASRHALEALENGARPEEVLQAESSVAAAKAGLDALLAGARKQEIAVLEAAVKAADAEEERAGADFERQRELRLNGLTSERDLERARTALEAARARKVEAEQGLLLAREGPRTETIEQAQAVLAQAKAALDMVKAGPRKEVLDQARASLDRAKATLDLVKAGARKETIDQARARIDQAEAALGVSQSRLAAATLTAPHQGVVLSEGARSGEYVSPGTPVATIGDLAEVWLRAYIAEPDLGRVKLGANAAVTVDSWPGKIFKGKVTYISSEAEFTPKNVQTREERAKLVFRVKITIPNPGLELKPGMPADAAIEPAD